MCVRGIAATSKKLSLFSEVKKVIKNLLTSGIVTLVTVAVTSATASSVTTPSFFVTADTRRNDGRVSVRPVGGVPGYAATRPRVRVSRRAVAAL